MSNLTSRTVIKRKFGYSTEESHNANQNSEPPRKKFSINNRLNKFRKVIESAPDSRSLKMYQVEDNSLQSRLNKVNSTTEKQTIPQVPRRVISGNPRLTYSSCTKEENLIIEKPLKIHLEHNSPIDYTRKCIEYLKSTDPSVSAAFRENDSEISHTPLPSYKSVSSFASNFSDNKKESDTQALDTQECFSPCNQSDKTFAKKNEKSFVVDVPMDWAPFDEKVILSNIQDIRTKMIFENEPKTEFQLSIQANAAILETNNNFLRNLYIVVDTNIFLSHIDVIKGIMDLKVNGVVSPIVYIPWIVIQELDYFKDGNSKNDFLKKTAQIAVKFINLSLQSGNKLLQGQNVRDAANTTNPSSNPDDGILNCCFQILERKNRAILLSNDINLRNKALLNNIPAYDHSNILKILDPYHNKSSNEVNNVKDIVAHFSHLFSLIILTEMKKSYGDVWNKMNLMTKPPWSLEECLQIFLKYWQAVFMFSLQKQAKKCFEDFKSFLSKGDEAIKKKSDELIENCYSVSNYLRNGLPDYVQIIDETLQKVKVVQNSS